MSRKKHKKPKVSQSLGLRDKVVADRPPVPKPWKKIDGVTPPGGWNTARPAWSLAKLDLSGPFGWKSLQPGRVEEVVGKLAGFETRTWAEILGPENHEIETSQLASAARRRLRELQLDDVDSLVSLRLDGKTRIFGVREQNTMVVLWWDPEHQICPSHKKHT